MFETSPVYEDENAVAFEFENTVVNLLRTSEAHSLIGPATVAAGGTGSRFQLTPDGHIWEVAAADRGARLGKGLTLRLEDRVGHQAGRVCCIETALPEAPPRVEVQREVERSLHALARPKSLDERAADRVHRLAAPKLEQLARQRIDLRVPQHAR